MIEFHLDTRSGVPTYLQLVQQVTPGGPARDPAARRSAADGEGGRRQPRDQPEHGAQGLPRARPERARRGPARAGDVRLEHDAAPCRPTTSRRSARRSQRWIAQRARGRARRREHRRAVRRHAAAAGVVEGGMSAGALPAEGLGKRYGSNWALRDCTLEIPAGSVTALRRPERRRQDDAAAARRRPQRGRARARCACFGHSPRDDAASSCCRASASSRRITRSTRASRSPRR